MHAVAAVRTAPDNPAQEHNIVPPFLNGYGIILDPFQHVLHGHQFMVVGGKKRLGFNPGLDIFHHGPGDSHAVISTGTPSHLVQNNQALGRGVFQNLGYLVHLHHEGALARG